jgi:hypothetical protein
MCRVVAVEAFFIPKAQKAQQAQSVKVLLFSLTIAGLCIIIMHQKAKLSTKNTIWKSSVIFVRQFGARDLTCGPHAIGNCIMTMPRLIHHTRSRVSWPNMAFQLFSRHGFL